MTYSTVIERLKYPPWWPFWDTDIKPPEISVERWGNYRQNLANLYGVFWPRLTFGKDGEFVPGTLFTVREYIEVQHTRSKQKFLLPIEEVCDRAYEELITILNFWLKIADLS